MRMIGRRRPTGRPGSFVVPESSAPRSSERLQWFPDMEVVPRMPPVYDAQLSSVLQSACLILDHVDPDSVVTLHGPTLLGWYHCGAQLPWKTVVHLIVHTARMDSLAAVAELLRARFETVFPGSTITETGDSLLMVNIAVEELVEGRTHITLSLGFVFGGAEQARQTHVRALIDGGITSTWVPAQVSDTKRMLVEWYGTEEGAQEKLPMPKDWVFDDSEKRFVRVAELRRAVMLPPSTATLKWVIIAVVLLCIVYLVGLSGLPAAGRTLDGMARAGRHGLRGGAVPIYPQ